MHATDRAKYIQIGVARIPRAAIVGGRGDGVVESSAATVAGRNATTGRQTPARGPTASGELKRAYLDVKDRQPVATAPVSEICSAQRRISIDAEGIFSGWDVPWANAEAVVLGYLHMSGCSSQEMKRPSGRLNV